MGDIVSFNREQVNAEKEKFHNICANLYSRIHYLYTKESKILDEQDKILYKKIIQIFPDVLNDKWLSTEEKKLFMEKIEDILKLEDETEELLCLMNYIYLSWTQKKTFLSQGQQSIKAFIDCLIDAEVPYTNYSNVAEIFLNKELLDKVISIKEMEPKHILISLLEDIDFNKHKDINLSNCFSYLDSLKESLKKKNPFERDIHSIYQYFFEQMQGFNFLLENSGNHALFREEHFKTLKKIEKLKYLDEEDKINFYDIIEQIDKNNNLETKCKFILSVIEQYYQFLKSKKTISMHIEEGDVNENRRF